MKQKYLYKTETNFFFFILLCILLYFIDRFVWVLGELSIYKYIICIISPILIYVSMCFFINKCYFYDDKIEIKFFFRFSNKVILIKYSELLFVKYICTYSKYSPPTIKLKTTRNSSMIFNLYYSFPLRSYKKRKEILRYLQSKEIKIEIDSVLEKDQYILDPLI